MASADGTRRFSTTFEPWRDFLSTLTESLALRLKARAPQLVPVFVCVIALPVLVLFAFIAGWIVWSNIPKGWSFPVYLQYGDGTIPYSDLEITSLSATHPYEISLQLSVPAIETNYALGNFMTSLKITTLANETVAEIRKPTVVVPPTSSLLPLSRAPRLLQMKVPLASFLITGASSVRAHLELGRRDGWRTLGRGEGRELTVYSASLHGLARPQGLSRILSTFPLSISIAASLIFFFFSSLILAGCLFPSLIQNEPEKQDREVKSEESELPVPAEQSTSFSRMRRRSSRVKQENDEEESPVSPREDNTSDSDIRRRLRQVSTHNDD